MSELTFWRLNNAILRVCVYVMFGLSLHCWIVFMWIFLPRTWVYKHLSKSLFSLLLCVHRPKSGSAESYGSSIFNCLRNHGLFPTAATPFCIPPVVHMGSHFSTSSSLTIFSCLIMCVCVFIFYYSHPKEVVRYKDSDWPPKCPSTGIKQVWFFYLVLPSDLHYYRVAD